MHNFTIYRKSTFSVLKIVHIDKKLGDEKNSCG